jgi:hypothetical protein
MEVSMSLFSKVLKEHEINSEATKPKEAAEMTVVVQTFSSDFDAAVSSVARPLFEEFANDALRNGFPSSIEVGADGNGNPFISVRFIPERGTAFGTDRSCECAFVLRGLLSDQKVELASFIDQRSGKNGVIRNKIEIQSLDKSGLQNLLTKFLRSSLATKDRI